MRIFLFAFLGAFLFLSCKNDTSTSGGSSSYALDMEAFSGQYSSEHDLGDAGNQIIEFTLRPDSSYIFSNKAKGDSLFYRHFGKTNPTKNAVVVSINDKEYQLKASKSVFKLSDYPNDGDEVILKRLYNDTEPEYRGSFICTGSYVNIFGDGFFDVCGMKDGKYSVTKESLDVADPAAIDINQEGFGGDVLLKARVKLLQSIYDGGQHEQEKLAILEIIEPIGKGSCK